jgi:hypothetical protein
MSFSKKLISFAAGTMLATAFLIMGASAANGSTVNVVLENNGDLGIIRGVVRDEGGSPIADATVAIFKLGTSKLLKQVQSSANGSFLARILPGTYTVLAVAQGFNPITLSDVEVNRSADLVYGFRLERAGKGNTLPEKRADRNSSKWRYRAAQMQRSIYQNRQGKAPIDETVADSEKPVTLVTEEDTRTSGRRSRGVVETYFGETGRGSYTAVNFAGLIPVGSTTEILVAGQTGKGKDAPLRFETGLNFQPKDNHQVRLTASFGKLGSVTNGNGVRSLDQFSLQAVDEWKFREGVILVLGMDYSRFAGAGDDFSLSPRLGVQFDVNAKTRVRSAYTTQTEEPTWSHAAELEGTSISFHEPVAVEDLVLNGDKPRMNRSSRVEFGVERVLDNRSSVEANAFFDTTFQRGVGLSSISIDPLGGNSLNDFVAGQQGNARGLRVVYSRRLTGPFSVSAGYSLGNGQKLSSKALSEPSGVFESSFFQTFFSQIAAELKSGTSVKTVFRLSPQATVFAIDPFKGRLAIYDPGLSVYVTQTLPTWGLPIRAEAVVDGRNLFDFQSGVHNEEGFLRINGQGRTVRGGILVRF